MGTIIVFVFPSLKGFDFGLDSGLSAWIASTVQFPSLKGFDFGLDEDSSQAGSESRSVSIPQRVRLRPRPRAYMCVRGRMKSFHPSKGSTSA